MTDHKFTDEEVIKATECCGGAGKCSDCPYYDNGNRFDGKCCAMLWNDTVALIKRQGAEIERLTIKQEAEEGHGDPVGDPGEDGFESSIRYAKSEAIKEYLAKVSDRSGIAALYSPHTPVVTLSVLEYYAKAMGEDKSGG